jgi:hypothetical protein
MGVVASIDFFGQTWPTQPHATRSPTGFTAPHSGETGTRKPLLFNNEGPRSPHFHNSQSVPLLQKNEKESFNC